MKKEKAIDKVRKLLALAQSDNPNEAKAALLRACAIMAEYKLSQRDINKMQSGELEEVTFERLTYSNLRNIWMPRLARVIGDAHCCAAVARHKEGSVVNRIVFVGLGDDPHIACTIFDYAVHHIECRVQDTRRKNKEDSDSFYGFSNLKYVNARTSIDVTNYGIGFASGLEKQYSEQNAEHSEEMSLMVIRPVQVENYLDGLEESDLKPRKVSHDETARQEGYEAGYRFNPTPQIRSKGGTQYVSE